MSSLITGYWDQFVTLIKLSDRIGEQDPSKTIPMQRYYQSIEDSVYREAKIKLTRFPLIKDSFSVIIKYNHKYYTFKIMFDEFQACCNITFTKEK